MAKMAQILYSLPFHPVPRFKILRSSASLPRFLSCLSRRGTFPVILLFLESPVCFSNLSFKIFSVEISAVILNLGDDFVGSRVGKPSVSTRHLIR